MISRENESVCHGRGWPFMAKGLVLLCVLPLHEDSSYLKDVRLCKGCRDCGEIVWVGLAEYTCDR